MLKNGSINYFESKQSNNIGARHNFNAIQSKYNYNDVDASIACIHQFCVRTKAHDNLKGIYVD